MTSEQNVPEVESHQGAPMSAGPQDGDEQFSGPNVPHGMGQSKSSRRRRRKRKNKGSDAPQGAQPDGEQAGEQAIGSIQAVGVQPQQAQPQGAQNFQAGAGQQQNGANGSSTGKRWKKKFRDRDRQRGPENPGNVASGSNGGGYRDGNSHQPGNNGYKRKGGGGGGGKQQRGPRSFVGPMDHSYRVVNGNFADTPPSTIETHGNFQARSSGRGYQSDSQPIDYSQGKTIPIPEDAPTKIYFFIEDLFFVAKIQETARKLGVKIAFIKNDKESITQLTGGEEEDRPGLIVFDLNNANAKPLTLIPKLKTKLKKSTSIVGFLSHLQGDLKAKAVEAGCDTVMPRAAFSQNLPNLLRRYGIADEDEPNYNQ
ncbi:MAG: response regulator [Acidobacteriales bacterium 59-55]|mgnify:CR=1 FL=1|nr:response regulator [Terriglobales bacterium]OJV43998.1 MAG: response regulator [Acidobacteriales bacterium 59-55]